MFDEWSAPIAIFGVGVALVVCLIFGPHKQKPAPPVPVDTTAVIDSVMHDGAAVQMESGLGDFDFFDIEEPSALVTQYTDTTIVYPIPPGSIIGIPHRYFVPVQRGNFY